MGQARVRASVTAGGRRDELGQQQPDGTVVKTTAHGAAGVPTAAVATVTNVAASYGSDHRDGNRSRRHAAAPGAVVFTACACRAARSQRTPVTCTVDAWPPSDQYLEPHGAGRLRGRGQVRAGSRGARRDELGQQHRECVDACGQRDQHRSRFGGYYRARRCSLLRSSRPLSERCPRRRHRVCGRSWVWTWRPAPVQ